jgi:hypothetical protein
MSSPPSSGEGSNAVTPPSTNLYTNATDGLKSVRDDYLYWTGKLTESSLQMSFAVIAANWAVFGSLQRVFSSCWAKTSLSLVVLCVASNLVGAKVMGELHKKRADYAAEDLERWNRAYEASIGRRDPWPFTVGIEILGRVLREIRTWLPLLGGVAFFIALFTN